MAEKTKCYVDTSAFIAFLDRSDSYHPLFKGLFADPPELLSSSLVIAEGHAWFLKRYDANMALRFVAFVEELSILSVHSVGREELAKAAWFLRKYSDQALTLADATGLLLMANRGIKKCWSTDRHLGLTGIKLVIND